MPEQDIPTLPKRTILGQQTPAVDQLCETCRKIDFNSLFNDTRPSGFSWCKHPLATTMMESCSFCRMVTRAAEQFVSLHRLPTPFRVRSSASRIYIVPEADVRRNDVAKYTRLQICSYITPVHCKGTKYTSYPTERPKKQVWLLDRVHDTMQESNDSKKCQMRRNILTEQFDPQLLRSWFRYVIERELDLHNRRELHDHHAGVGILISLRLFRVLDVYKKEIIILKKFQRYCALSYVWGSALAQKASDPSTWPMKWEDVPRTIRDAASVLEEIGEQYLWVDLLCIAQDQPEDQKAILPWMGSIYAIADLTIVAADSEHADSGLCRFNKRSAIPEQAVQISSDLLQVTLVERPPNLEESLSCSALKKRAWAFQELCLSRRCCVFTKREVFFSSKSLEAREAYEIEERPNAVYKTDSMYRKPWQIAKKLNAVCCFDLDLYGSVVKDYSSRDLTFPGDKFDAFAALTARYDQEPDRSALSGLPKSIFPAALLWKRINKAAWMTRIELDKRGTRTLPSWSWVGWIGAVSYEGVSTYDFESVQVEEADAIFFKISKQPWNYHVEPYIPSPLLCVTLHVWTKAQRCCLEKQLWSLGAGIYDIFLFDGKCNAQRIFWYSIEVYELDIQEIDVDAEYEIIELGIQILEGRKSYMITKLNGCFAERIGLVSMSSPSPKEDLFFSVNAIDKHIRLR